MPAYAYPIRINRNREMVRFEENVTLQDDWLTLPALAFVGNDTFTVGQDECGLWVICVNRQRPETDEEMNARIARGESYMAEYNRRQANT